MYSAVNKDKGSNPTDKRFEQMNLLSNILKTTNWSDPTSFLFGYTLANIDLKTQGRTIENFKLQFASLREQLTTYKHLKIDDAAMIVVDLIQELKTKGSGINLNSVMDNNLWETVQNRQYILNKWKRQDENQKNELLILKMLEQQEQAEIIKAKEEEKKGWECQICLTDIDPSYFGLLECKHIFHPECINGYLQAQIEASNLDIRCPSQTCKQKMQTSDIMTYIDGELKEKYLKFTFNKYVESNTGSVSWCPTAGCTAVFEFDEALDNYRCPNCHKHYCLKCRCEYHTGMSCAEYKVNKSFDKNDQKFIDFVKGAKFKQCPKCKYWVERSQGCSSMMCKCGQQFCYNCGGTGCPHGRCSNSGGGKKGLLGGLFG